MRMRFRLGFVAGVLIVGCVLMGCGSSSGSSLSSPESNTSTEENGTPDAIEQARMVIDGNHSYEAVKGVSDRALNAAGESLSDENRSRAWSSVLETKKI